MKNKYHILFKDNKLDVISKGVNIEANTPEEALFTWRAEYPAGIFLGIFSFEIMNQCKLNIQGIGINNIKQEKV